MDEESTHPVHLPREMQRPTHTTEILAALERDSVWLHRLAHALTRDTEAASDAVQTTLLRAWQRALGGVWPRRAWLARVAKNALHEEARRDGSRRNKERDIARNEAEEGACGLERLELQRQVADAVDALPEPYRGTLVLRFFDGLSPRAIAARQGLPAKTVYTRIERGLAKLREQLDARFGNDRAVWVGAMLALPNPGWSWTSTIKGASTMGLGIKIAGATVAVVVGALVLMQTDAQHEGDTPTRAPRMLATSDAQPGALENDQLPPQSTLLERIPSPTSEANEPEPEAPLAAVASALSGHVHGTDGQPLAGVGVRVRSGNEARATTDAMGRFTMDCERDQLPISLVIDDDRYATLRVAHVNRTTVDRDHVIVAARAAELRGRVLDEYGRPVEDAAVSVIYDEGLLVDFPLVLDTTARVQPRANTVADGRFELLRVAVESGCELRAELAGYATAHLTLAEPYSTEWILELRTLTAGEREPQAEGLVLLPNGAPAEGATVHYGSNDTMTDADGRFTLPLDYDPDPDLQLAAALEGYGTTLVEGYGELQTQSAPYAPALVTLVLRENSLALAGRVVDANGMGLSGWTVQLSVGTPLTRNRVPPILAEALDVDSTSAETSDTGHFALSGLLDRAYDLLAYNSDSLVALRVGPFAAGATDIVLEVADDLAHPRVSGRIVSRGGQPIAGASVSVGLVLHSMENGRSWIAGDIIQTGANGRFELTDVARAEVHLNIEGETIVPRHYEFEAGDNMDDLVIEVALRCHFRVEVEGSDLHGLRVEVQDAQGQRVMITTFQAGGSGSSGSKALIDGRMAVSAVSDDATQLILIRSDENGREELERRELHLVPGEVLEVRMRIE